MRWWLAGFGVGIAVDLIAMVIQVAGSEYTIQDAPELFAWYLFLAPFMGGLLGFVGLSLNRQPGPWRWRRPQFRTRTLMVMIAYGAFLASTSVTFYRYATIAGTSQSKAIIWSGMAKNARAQESKFAAEVRSRRENLAELRAGKIPRGLNPVMVDVLRSLEDNPKLTPAYRVNRRDLVRKTEEWFADTEEGLRTFWRSSAEYDEDLATKYQQASLRPWLPIEPDPPAPKPAPSGSMPLNVPPQ